MTETFMGERIANMKDDEEEEEEEKEVDNEKAEDEKPANALSKTMAVTVADFEIGLSKHSLKLWWCGSCTTMRVSYEVLYYDCQTYHSIVVQSYNVFASLPCSQPGCVCERLLYWI